MDEARYRQCGKMEAGENWFYSYKCAMQVSLFGDTAVNNCEQDRLEQQYSEQGNGTIGKLVAQLIDECSNVAIDDLQGEELVQACLNALDSGNANAMYQLARCCLDGSATDEQVQQLAENKTFNTKLNELARSYALGFAEPDSDQEVFQICTRVQDQNDQHVLSAIGKCYRFGWGVERDISKAIEYYVKAADAGLFGAMNRLHMCRNQNADDQLKAAFEHFQQLAAAGNANAQFCVAYCYCWNVGVKEDNGLAVQLLFDATDRGCLNAVISLAFMYEKGRAVDQDFSKAIELYKKAAEMGNYEAQCRLAWNYHQGTGGARDLESAISLYQKSAEQGGSKAAKQLGNCHAYGNGVEKDEVKAFQYYKQSAVIGNHYAQYHCGRRYYNGIGTEQNFKRAAYWFQKAADQGTKDVTGMFEDCLKKTRWNQYKPESVGNQDQAVLAAVQDELVQQRQETTFYLAKLASVNGCKQAFELVGDCFYSGCGIAKDYRAAALNYELTDTTNPKTLLRLVECHQSNESDGNELDAFSALQRANTALRGQINAALAQIR